VVHPCQILDVQIVVVNASVSDRSTLCVRHQFIDVRGQTQGKDFRDQLGEGVDEADMPKSHGCSAVSILGRSVSNILFNLGRGPVVGLYMQ
jgi:hypothetical protein